METRPRIISLEEAARRKRLSEEYSGVVQVRGADLKEETEARQRQLVLEAAEKRRQEGILGRGLDLREPEIDPKDLEREGFNVDPERLFANEPRLNKDKVPVE